MNQVGAVFKVDLPELIEGLEYHFEAKISNKTNSNWQGLRTDVGCRCLRVESGPNDVLSDAGVETLSLRILPTATQFAQELKVFAKSDQKDASTSNEILLCKFLLSAKTRPPVLCSHQLIVFNNQEKVRVTLTPGSSRFRIVTDKIRLSEEDLACECKSVDHDTVEVTFSEGSSLIGLKDFRKSFFIQVPLVYDAANEVRWFRVELIASKFGDILVSPQTVVFRKTDSGYSGFVLIQDRLGSPVSETPNYILELTTRLNETKQQVVIEEAKDLGGNRQYLRLKVSDLDTDSVSELQLSVSHNGKVVKRLPISILK